MTSSVELSMPFTSEPECRACQMAVPLNFDGFCPSCVADSKCECGGTKRWCSQCLVWSKTCCEEYGSCQCS
jgi:hypothetical protein